jgi:hypothetical protein
VEDDDDVDDDDDVEDEVDIIMQSSESEEEDTEINRITLEENFVQEVKNLRASSKYQEIETKIQQYFVPRFKDGEEKND